MGDLQLRVGDRVQMGEALVELGKDNAWSARVSVQQIDRPKLRTGQQARVFVESYPHLQYGVLEGSVTAIAEEAQAGGTDYAVDVEIDATDLALADGMAADVRVTVDSGRLLRLVWHRLLRQFGQARVQTQVSALHEDRG